MKMSRIVKELERQGIDVTYGNIVIFAVFVSEEGLTGRLDLDDDSCTPGSSDILDILKLAC